MRFDIAPSILSFDMSRLCDAVPDLEAKGAEWLHLDVMDGQFVPPISFGDGLVRSLRPLVKMPFEAHLMTLTPEAQFEAFAAAGCRRIIFHAEATMHAHRLVQRLHSMGLEAGIALNPGTPASALDSVLGDLDIVLVMTVNPGWGGQAFIESTLPKIRAIREAAPDVAIEVDGGIDPKTLPLVRGAGADTYVVGSYLLKQPLAEGLAALRSSCD